MWDSFFNGVRCGILISMVSDVGFFNILMVSDVGFFDGVRCGIRILMVSDVGFVF